MPTDYAGRVNGYIFQNDGVLGLELTLQMRKELEGTRPLTKEDAE